MRILNDHSLLKEHRSLLFQNSGRMRFACVENEYIYFRCTPNDFQEDMMLCCSLCCRTRTWKGYYFRRINPPFLNIGIVHSGEQLVHYGSEYRIVEQNDVLILPPDEDYELLTPEKCEKSGVILHGPLLKELLARCGFTGCTILPLASIDYLDSCFSRLGQVMEETRSLSARRKVAEICFEIIQYLASPDPVNRYPAPLAAALELIGERYGQPLTLSDIAAAGKVSESGISRLFRRHFNMTPHRYLTALRMRQAEAMLRQHLFLVKEVAAKVGYENSLNFSTEFKKFFGYSPSHLVTSR